MLCEAVLQRPAGLTDVDFGAVSTRNPVDYTSSLRKHRSDQQDAEAPPHRAQEGPEVRRGSPVSGGRACHGGGPHHQVGGCRSGGPQPSVPPEMHP